MENDSNIILKCCHTNESYDYINNIKYHYDKIKYLSDIDENEKINIKILFHLLFVINSDDKHKILQKLDEMIKNLNNDFNNYGDDNNFESNNLNTKISLIIFFTIIMIKKIYIWEMNL